MSSTYIVIKVTNCAEDLARRLIETTGNVLADSSLSPVTELFGLDEVEWTGSEGTFTIDGKPSYEGKTLTLLYETAPSTGPIWLREVMLKLREMTNSNIYSHAYSTQDGSALFFKFEDPKKVEVLSEDSSEQKYLEEKALDTIEHGLTLDEYIGMNESGSLDHIVAFDLTEVELAELRKKPLYKMVVWIGRFALFGGILFGIVKCTQSIF